MITKRGKRVRAIAILIGLWLGWQIATHLWWTGENYCWGDAIKCVIS